MINPRYLVDNEGFFYARNCAFLQHKKIFIMHKKGCFKFIEAANLVF
jgi:hypothetical protein